MKKVVCFVVMLVMAAALAIVATGCSKHESEHDEQQEKLEEALEEFQANQETGGAADKVPDPNAEPVDIIMVYSVKEGDTGLKQNMDDVPAITDESLSDKLIEYKVLPEGAELSVFDPYNNIISYTGVTELTPRQAIAILNTFIENFEFDGQWELQIDGNPVMKSGYCADWKTVDDNFEGGADDFDSTSSASGPGVQ